MNILLIHQAFLEKDDSGGSRFNEMTKIWSEEGHSVTVLAGMMHYAKAKKRKEYKGKFTYVKWHDKIRVIRCFTSENYNKNFIGRMWAYFSFVFSSCYAGVFKAKEKYDIIICTSPPLTVALTALLLKKIKRIPLVFEIRDLWPESAIDTGVLTNLFLIKLAFRLEKKTYQKSSLINVLTPAFKHHLIERKNVAEDKISEIYNACDFTLSDNLFIDFDRNLFRKDCGWENKFIVIYVGAHGIANGLDQVLDVSKRLNDTNITFVLLGDGMEKKRLMTRVINENISNVLFWDSVPKSEIFKYIYTSDLGASILSKNDTFKTVYSNKTFDYMACKRPVLMAIDGVSRQLVEDSKCGVFVEPENIDDFETKLRLIYSNSLLLNEYGENGYVYAKQNFDRRKLAKDYINNIVKII